jgi:hypothetical protein
VKVTELSAEERALIDAVAAWAERKYEKAGHLRGAVEVNTAAGLVRVMAGAGADARPCRFLMEPTGESGIHSGRSRYRVTCLTHRLVLHRATTGPIENINAHLRDPVDGCAYQEPMREGE